LSPEEVLHFLDCVERGKHRVILTTCYAAGLRVSEAVQLRPNAIDSRRTVIRVSVHWNHLIAHIVHHDVVLVQAVTWDDTPGPGEALTDAGPSKALCVTLPSFSPKPRGQSIDTVVGIASNRPGLGSKPTRANRYPGYRFRRAVLSRQKIPRSRQVSTHC